MENTQIQNNLEQEILEDGKFGVFVYYRRNEENIDNNVYFNTEEEAKKCFDLQVEYYNKKKYFVEMWEKGDDDLWGNSGEPINSSF